MTWKAWPINASAGAPSYDAQAFRQLESVWFTPHPTGSSRPLGATSGRTPFSWIVTLSGLTINIAAGAGVLDVEAAATNGAYRVVSDATDSTLTLTAQGGTARIDGVYVQLDDTDIDSSTFRKALPAYVAGTPGSGTPPSGGAIPARSLRIATVNVPISGGGSPSVVLEPLYTVALGGVLPVASSSAYPGTPYIGQTVYDLALGYQLNWNGTIWTAGPQPTWTNANFGATGFQALGAPFETPGYSIDKFGFVRGRGYVQNNSGGTKATGTTMFTLPVGSRPLNTRGWVASDVVTSGYTMRVEVKSDGSVIINNGGAIAMANLAFVTLDVVGFYAQQ